MTKKSERSSTDTQKKNPKQIDIKDINDAKWIGKYVQIRGTITEKDKTPYIARTIVEMDCKSNFDSVMCSRCPHIETSHGELKLNVFDPELLYFIDGKERELATLYRNKMEIPNECKKPKFSKYSANKNLYRCSIVPCIDYVSAEKKSVGETVDNMYSIHVNAALFGDLEVYENRDYLMSGVPQINPTNGRLTFLIDNITPIADDISSFDMTEEHKKMLSSFQCEHTFKAVDLKNQEILKEKRVNHHKVFGYGRMEYFVHMVFHSVSAFTFNRSNHFRGWLDGAIIGDSRTGKSEITEQSINLHQMGYRAACDNVTQAGITGGMSQSSIKGGEYQLKWGLLPRLDRRLIVFDECHSPNAIGIWPKLNDARSSGLVKLSKVGAPDRTTKARVRKMFVANPPNGQTTRDYYNPVEMVSQIFQTPESIARLDFLYIPRVEDSTYQKGEENETVFPNYCIDIDKLLLQFIYSRTADQVVFTEEAEKYITDKAAELSAMSDGIHIPLLQANEARFTLARGAAAQAASLCSVSDNWESIVVHKAHAEVWVETLVANYNHESNNYFAYSRNAMKKIKFANSEEFFEVCGDMKSMFKGDKGLIRYILEENLFNFRFLGDITKLGQFDLKSLYSGMVRHNLIKTKATNSSFTKTRRGIAVFKYLLYNEELGLLTEKHCKEWFDNLDVQ